MGCRTRPRHEKIVAQRLEERGVKTFLPLVTEVHRWSDRKKSVQMPLFSCYVFASLCRIDRSVYVRSGLKEYSDWWAPVAKAFPFPTSRWMRFAGWWKALPWASHPFLKIGQRVRIRSGALDGLEGILVSRNGDSTLVISVDAIQRSLSVRVEGYAVEAV